MSDWRYGKDSLNDPLVSSPRNSLERGHSTATDEDGRFVLLYSDPEQSTTTTTTTSNKKYQLVSLSYPIMLSHVLSFLISLMSVAFIGRMIPGEDSLAASILATTLFNATGLSLLSGCMSALETMAGNAYGMGRYEAVGHLVQKALVLDAVLCWFIIMFWMYGVEALLLHTVYGSRDDKMGYVYLACRFLKRTSPGLVLHAVFESLKRYLGCQKIVRPVTWSAILGFISCPVYNYILIGRFGLDGAALAQVAIMLTQTLSLVMMTVWIDWRKSHTMPQTWTGISLDAITNKGQYYEFLRLAIPGLFMILSEWWAFEVLVILAGMLPVQDAHVYVGAMGILVQLSGLVWTIVSAVCFAGTILISTSLGRRDPENARAHCRELFKVSLALQVSMALVLITARHHIGRLFSSSDTLVDIISNTIPIFALTLIPDGINIPMQNIIKACGKQQHGALVNILYWAVIPLGAFLGIHHHLLINGLWLAILAINTLLCLALSLTYTFTIDFTVESDNAAQRLHQ